MIGATEGLSTGVGWSGLRVRWNLPAIMCGWGLESREEAVLSLERVVARIQARTRGYRAGRSCGLDLVEGEKRGVS